MSDEQNVAPPWPQRWSLEELRHADARFVARMAALEAAARVVASGRASSNRVLAHAEEFEQWLLRDHVEPSDDGDA